MAGLRRGRTGDLFSAGPRMGEGGGLSSRGCLLRGLPEGSGSLERGGQQRLGRIGGVKVRGPLGDKKG